MADRFVKFVWDETNEKPNLLIEVFEEDTHKKFTLEDTMLSDESDEVLDKIFTKLGYKTEHTYVFGEEPFDFTDDDFGEDLGEPFDWEEKDRRDRDPEGFDGDTWREPEEDTIDERY